MWHYNYTDTLYHGNYSPAYMATDYDNSLAHYGVLGMKWGVRKQRESSGSRVGGRRQLSAKTKKRLKALAIGAGAATAAGLATGGAIMFAKSGGFKGIKSRNALRKNFRTMTNNQAIDALEGVRYTTDAKRNLRNWMDLKAAQKGMRQGARDAIRIGDRRTHLNKGAYAISKVKNSAKQVGNAAKKTSSKARNYTYNMLADQRNYVRTHPRATAFKTASAAGLGAIAGGAGAAYGVKRAKKKRNS